MTEKEVRHIEQLIMEKLAGVISKADSTYLESLLENDEDIQLKWQEEKTEFEEQTQSYLRDIDEEEAWEQVKEGISSKSKQRKRKNLQWWIAAAVLLPAIFAVLFLFKRPQENNKALSKNQENSVQLMVKGGKTVNLSQYNPSKNLPLLNNVRLNVKKGRMSYASLNNRVNDGLNTLLVPTAKTYNITLSDGTEVTLNSVSSLKFPFVFSGDKREVWLQGEAYFDVAKNEEKPFIVHTLLTTIQVIGTSFNVNTYDSSLIKTSLVNGTIRTRSMNQSVELKPGFEAIFSPDAGFRIKAFEANHTLSWMQGVYYFEDVPLAKMAPVIQRWFGKKLIFDDSAASSNRFTGAMLKNKPVNEFLSNLSLTSDIHYYFKDDAIHIRSH